MQALENLRKSNFGGILSGEVAGLEGITYYLQLKLINASPYYAKRNTMGLLSMGVKSTTIKPGFVVDPDSEEAKGMDVLEAPSNSDSFGQALSLFDSTITRLQDFLDQFANDPYTYGLHVGYLIYTGVMPHIKDKINFPEEVINAYNQWYTSLTDRLDSLVTTIKDAMKEYPAALKCQFIRMPYTMGTSDPNKINDDGPKKCYNQLLKVGLTVNEIDTFWHQTVYPAVLEYRQVYGILFNPQSRYNKRDFAVNILASTKYKFSMSAFKYTIPSMSKNLAKVLGNVEDIYLVQK